MDHTTLLSLSLRQSEKDFILDAVRFSRATNTSAFLREAALEKARAVLGAQSALAASPAKLPPAPAPVLHTYIKGWKPADIDPPCAAFSSLRSFCARLSDRNREILRWLAANEPDSIFDLSQRFGYPYTYLASNLRKLETLGLVGFEGPTPHRKLRPHLRYGCLRLVLPFRPISEPSARMLRLAVKAQAGEAVPEDADFTFGSMPDLATAISDRTLQLAGVVAARGSLSITALAELAGSTMSNIQPRLENLARVGAVAIRREGRGKKVSLCHDGIVVELLFG